MRYSEFNLNQLMEYKKFQKISKMFLDLSVNRDDFEVLKSILYEGGYNNLAFTSEISNANNVSLETRRRLDMAYLYVTAKNTFNFLVDNNINIFHGTNSKALPSILKNGLYSFDLSTKNSIKVESGEKWSRIHGRSFISFTDVLSIAEGYSTLKDEDSFEAIICTTKESLSKKDILRIHSSVPEVGIKDCLPLEDIKAILVPKENVGVVKSFAKDINVLPMYDIKEKFYTVNELGIIDIDYDKYNSLKNKKNSKLKRTLLEIKKVIKSYSFDDVKKNR